MEHSAKVTSSVAFVSDLNRSVEFYRDVFSCEVTIQRRDAALLLAPDGFQLYLIARGGRTIHPSGGVGLQYLIWAVDSTEALHGFKVAVERRGGRADTSSSGGVTFIGCRDPDGIRILLAHPSPQELPRSVVDARLYT